MPRQISDIVYDTKQAWEMPVDVINSGYCKDFAEDVLSKIEQHTTKEATLVKTEDVFEEKMFSITMPVHYWVSAEGIHYDAEVPMGVNRPQQIPFFSRLEGDQLSSG